MSFKKIIPSMKDVKKIQNNILEMSRNLKDLILQCDWQNKCNINTVGLEYSCMYYVLEFYRQVMSIKYSKFFIECTIRTIFISLENNLKNAGNKFEKNYLLNMYLKLNKTIHELYHMAKENKVDEIEFIVAYMLSDEYQMTEEELELNEVQLKKIAHFFDDIINISETEL